MRLPEIQREGGFMLPVAPATVRRGGVEISCGDSLRLSEHWPSPTVIVADGPYGVGSFPGDPPTPERLAEWYRPHIEQWSKRATPQTTLWFWNTELGWATVHPVLLANDWEYRCCHIWDKGKGHVAGNANSKTLRKFPVVTEVCVQYVRKVRLPYQGKMLPIKEWLRAEWLRSGLPLCETNQACGVINAATRKYFTKCHLWYFPPPDHFEKLVAYANLHGKREGRPYFSSDGRNPLTGEEWSQMRAKFYCLYGVSNVWSEPPVRGTERLKKRSKCLHLNQKPLALVETTLRASSDEGDVVWEPFGGLCSVAVACLRLNRRCYSAELLDEYYQLACRRLATDARSARSAKTSLAQPVMAALPFV